MAQEVNNNIERFGEVLKSTNYNLFHKLKGNRKINEVHVRRLMKSIGHKQLVVPIIVNEYMEIIDGQHRYEACRRLGKPIYYIGIAGYNLDDCHILNANNRTYKPEDFLIGYCEIGLPEYKRFKEFKDKYQFLSLQLCMIYLAGTSRSKNTLMDFKSGDYEIKNYDLGCLWAERTQDLIRFNFSFLRSRNFNYALIKLYKHPNYDHARFLSKLEYQTGLLRAQAKEKYYLDILCDIYNNRARDDSQRIYTHELYRLT